MSISSDNHSASTSAAAGNGNISTQGYQPVVEGSVTMSRGKHSSSPSIQGNDNAPPERMAWRKKSSNKMRPPNRNILRINNNCGDIHERPFNETGPSYQAPNDMTPHMELPQPSRQPYGMRPPPILPVPFIGNPEPSTSSSIQGLSVFPHASYGAYYYPTHPHAGCFIPLQDSYAAQRSYFSYLLDDLRTRLWKQIEYYFSLENLEKDFYLKRHMDANGWVPITLIVEFRRIQDLIMELQLLDNYLTSSNFMPDLITQLTNNEQFILDSLRSSYDVEVQGDKVRKRHDWEKWVSSQNLAQTSTSSSNQPQTTPN